jgi:hypothetical protein
MIDAGTIAVARAVRIDDEIARRGIRLRGKVERIGPCPVCGGADRFSINTRKQVFNCRGFGGGDVIAMVQHLDGCTFAEAVLTLAGAQWVSVLAFDPEAIEVADRLVQGARVYVEGKLELSEWTGSNGAKRQGLNVLSWHCRLPHIGRNKPKKKPSQDPAPASKDGGSATCGFHSDPVPF